MIKVDPGYCKDYMLKFALPMIDQSSFQPKQLPADLAQTLAMLTPCWVGKLFKV